MNTIFVIAGVILRIDYYFIIIYGYILSILKLVMKSIKLNVTINTEGFKLTMNLLWLISVSKDITV